MILVEVDFLPGFDDQPLSFINKDDICEYFALFCREKALDLLRLPSSDEHFGRLYVGTAIEAKWVNDLFIEVLLCKFVMLDLYAILLEVGFRVPQTVIQIYLDGLLQDVHMFVTIVLLLESWNVDASRRLIENGAMLITLLLHSLERASLVCN